MTYKKDTVCVFLIIFSYWTDSHVNCTHQWSTLRFGKIKWSLICRLIVCIVIVGLGFNSLVAKRRTVSHTSHVLLPFCEITESCGYASIIQLLYIYYCLTWQSHLANLLSLRLVLDIMCGAYLSISDKAPYLWTMSIWICLQLRELWIMSYIAESRFLKTHHRHGVWNGTGMVSHCLSQVPGWLRLVNQFDSLPGRHNPQIQSTDRHL